MQLMHIDPLVAVEIFLECADGFPVVCSRVYIFSPCHTFRVIPTPLGRGKRKFGTPTAGFTRVPYFIQ